MKADLLTESGRKFKDPALEERYQEYKHRKELQGETPRDRLGWKQASDWWVNESPMARGNDFNAKARAERWYKVHELNLEDGTRLDSYVQDKEIISRKATDLSDIDVSTFESYLDELKEKYPEGKIIRSNQYPKLDGKPLKGQHVLEIPDSNRSFKDINKYIEMAKKRGIEIRFRPE